MQKNDRRAISQHGNKHLIPESDDSQATITKLTVLDSTKVALHCPAIPRVVGGLTGGCLMTPPAAPKQPRSTYKINTDCLFTCSCLFIGDPSVGKGVGGIADAKSLRSWNLQSLKRQGYNDLFSKLFLFLTPDT